MKDTGRKDKAKQKKNNRLKLKLKGNKNERKGKTRRKEEKKQSAEDTNSPNVFLFVQVNDLWEKCKEKEKYECCNYM